MNKIKIWYQNVRGLRTKNDFLLSIASSDYHVVCVTGTLLSNKHIIIIIFFVTTFLQRIVVLELKKL